MTEIRAADINKRTKVVLAIYTIQKEKGRGALMWEIKDNTKYEMTTISKCLDSLSDGGIIKTENEVVDGRWRKLVVLGSGIYEYIEAIISGDI